MFGTDPLESTRTTESIPITRPDPVTWAVIDNHINTIKFFINIGFNINKDELIKGVHLKSDLSAPQCTARTLRFTAISQKIL